MENQYFYVCPSGPILNPFAQLFNHQEYPYSLYSYNQIFGNYLMAPLIKNQGNCEIKQHPEIKSQLSSQILFNNIQNKPISKFKYAKKNVQSNVVNQCLSFLINKHKNSLILEIILKDQEKRNQFYQILKLGKKKLTRYMGRSVLQNLLNIDEDHPIYILYKKIKYSLSIKLSQIRFAIKILINYFFRNVIIPSILTSAKMDKSTVRQHIARAREIHLYLTSTQS